MNKEKQVKSIDINLDHNKWIKYQIDKNSFLYKPKFMNASVNWNNIEGVKKSKVPYILVRKLNSKIVELNINSGLVREIPFFYTVQNNNLCISDSPYNIYMNNELDELGIEEFLTFGFSLSDRTIYKDVYQLEAGEEIVYKHGIFKVETKFLYDTESSNVRKPDQLKRDFMSISNEIFNGLKSTLHDKTILLPLSSGYDSRYIASMLKLTGFDNVICFTWGKPGDSHVKICKEIARKLDYDWHLVTYSDNSWFDTINAPNFNKVIVDSTNGSSISGIAALPFQKYLAESNIEIKNSVIIPGHDSGFTVSGDLFLSTIENPDRDDISKVILDYHSLKYNDNQKVFNNLKSQVRFFLENNSGVQSLRTWIWRERQAKFIINSNRYYEQIGLSWCLPSWDYRLVDFWQSVDSDKKNGRSFYYELLENELFPKVGLDFALKKSQMSKKTMLKKKLGFIRHLKVIHKLKMKFRKNVKISDEYGFELAFSLINKRYSELPNQTTDKIEKIIQASFSNPTKPYFIYSKYALGLLIKGKEEN